MPGFANYDAIINALTVNLKGQYAEWWKASFTIVSGVFSSFWNGTGFPAAGTFGTALTARAIDRTSQGATSFVNPTSPAQLFATYASGGGGNTTGTILFYDRLAEYPINGTVLSGTFTSVALPARDQDGTTAGRGVFLFVENPNATTMAAVNLTINYTNSAGTAGRVMPAFTTAAAIQHRLANPVQPFQTMFSTDEGIRSIQSYTLGASALSTQINLVLARPLFSIPIASSGNVVMERDLVLQRPSLPRLYDGTAIGSLIVLTSTATGAAFGRIEAVEG